MVAFIQGVTELLSVEESGKSLMGIYEQFMVLKPYGSQCGLYK